MVQVFKDGFWYDTDELIQRIAHLEAQVAAADALAERGKTLALRLTHIVGREDVVVTWETALAAYNEAKKGPTE